MTLFLSESINFGWHPTVRILPSFQPQAYPQAGPKYTSIEFVDCRVLGSILNGGTYLKQNVFFFPSPTITFLLVVSCCYIVLLSKYIQS